METAFFYFIQYRIAVLENSGGCLVDTHGGCGRSRRARVPSGLFSEISRGLTAEAPLRMLDELEACGLWARLYADIALTPSVRALVERLARDGASLDLRLLALTSGAETGGCGTPLSEVRSGARLRARSRSKPFWSQRDAHFQHEDARRRGSGL